MAIEYQEYQPQEVHVDSVADLKALEKQHRQLKVEIKKNKALPRTTQTVQQLESLQGRVDVLELQHPVLIRIRDDAREGIPPETP